MKWVWISLLALAFAIGFFAWRDSERKAQIRLAKASPTLNASSAMHASKTPKPPEPAPEKPLIPMPGEPSEQLLIDFLQAEYAQINAAGGMPVVVTASGRQHVLRPKIYSARKLECRLMPTDPYGYECSLDLMVTLREGDTKPGKHAERVHAYWDPHTGQWLRERPQRHAKP